MSGELERVRELVRRALEGDAPYTPRERSADRLAAVGVSGAAHDGGALSAAASPPGRSTVPAGTALVVRTSGSTGVPREVALSAEALRASAHATHERLGGPGRWFLALPATHVAGLQVISRSVVAGTDVGGGEPGPFTPEGFAVAAGRFLSDGGTPGQTGEADSTGITDLRGDEENSLATSVNARGDGSGARTSAAARAYVSLVPTQAYRLLEAADAGSSAGLDTLARFDGVLLGGAATPPALLTRLRDAGVRAVTTYGMSETCGGCVYDGVPLPGVRVRLADDADRDQGSGVGVVELSGPVLATGYLGDDDATAAAFRTDPDGTRWLRTSDLGSIDADGRLSILGRADDMIVTGGVNVAPAAVEAALADLGEVCVVGVPDREWGQAVVAVLVADHRTSGAADRPPAIRPADAEIAQQARELVKKRLNRAAIPRRVYLADRFPSRGPGKTDRVALTVAVRLSGMKS